MRHTAIKEQEDSLVAQFSVLEFPPEGVVTIEWADGVKSLQTEFSSILQEWQEIKTPPGFEEHFESKTIAVPAR